MKIGGCSSPMVRRPDLLDKSKRFTLAKKTLNGPSKVVHCLIKAKKV